MTYDLLLAGGFDRAVLANALADLTGVPVDAVDVADRNTEDRAWESPVLCTYEPAGGDVTWLLDIYLAADATCEPDVSTAAGLIAARLDIPVLWAAPEPLPSAFWLVTPDGTRTRARVYENDGDPVTYQVDAVEKQIPAFLSAHVEPLPEVIREHPVPTPTADEIATWLAGDDVVLPEGTHDSVRQAHIWLTVWEQLTQRMAAGWPPDGWYPADFYRDDLTARDKLGTALTHLPAAVTGRFNWATSRIDEQFKTLTHETTTQPSPSRDAWWWQRVPQNPGTARA